MDENLGLICSILNADGAQSSANMLKALFLVKITIFGEISSVSKVCYDFCGEEQNRVDKIITRKN